MNDLELIKRRVRKLLALSESPNENEAATALRKANELMAEYSLGAEAFSEYTRENIKSTKRFVRWRFILANAVENLYATYHYSDSAGNIVFVGEKLDVLMSSEMYKYLVKTIDRMAARNIRKNAKYRYRQSYRAGIARRLYDRMHELGQQCSWRNPEKLRAKQQEIRIFTEKQVALVEQKAKRGMENITAFARGLYDGDSVSLNRQMTNDSTRRIGGW